MQNGGTGSYFGNTYTPTGAVKIDGSQVLLAPDDAADATVWNAQSIVSVELGGERWLVNRTYFESVEAEKHSSYYFYSWLPTSHTAENRTEIVADFTTGGEGGWRHETISGLSLRYEKRVSYVDILNEVFNAFDVTMDPSTLVLPLNQLFFVQPVPGSDYLATPGGRYPRPGRSYSTGLSATLDSELGGAGLFAQDHIRFNSRWSLLLAGRLDGVTVDTVDPLPRAGFEPVGDSIEAWLPSGTVSLIFKPSVSSTVYATWNQAAAVEGSSSSGGFGLTMNRLREETFENSSELVEVGGKMRWLENRLFAGVALYHQKRNRKNVRFDLPDEIEVQGLEIEAVFQPNRVFNAGANFSYSEARYVDGPLPRGIQTVPYFDPASPSGNFGAYPSGDYRVPGLPRWLFNTYVSGSLANGLGASLSLNAQGEQNLYLFGHVKIRDQQTWNAAVFYKRKRFEARVDFLNLTDEFNWRSSSTPFAGADLVTRELPFHVQGSIKYAF